MTKDPGQATNGTTDQVVVKSVDAAAASAVDPTTRSASTDKLPSASIRPLRWTPAAWLLALAVLVRFVPGMVDGPSFPILLLGFMGPAVLSALVVVWWVLASRATLQEKVVGTLALVAIFAASMFAYDSSLMGPALLFWVIPVGMAGFAVPLIVASHHPNVRLPLGILGALMGFGGWALVRSEGTTGEFIVEFQPRWTRTAEETYLESISKDKSSPSKVPTEKGAGTTALDESQLASSPWPDFRGRNRDGVIHGVKLEEDWTANPPKLVWKREIGPGWSSFATAGGLLFTQEQRGEQEAVVALNADTGETVWSFETPARFSESISGAGPRATPTVSSHGLFAVGAQGSVVCLDPSQGKVRWEQQLRELANRQPPTWGYSCSPLVFDDVVIVHAGGTGDAGVFGFDCKTGKVRWQVASGDHSYSSPQMATFADTTGFLLATNEGLQFLDPKTGQTIWNYEAKSGQYRAIQSIVEENTIVFATSLGNGVQKLDVQKEDNKWNIEPIWNSRDLKPDFNDMVQCDDSIYGFDGTIFASINAETGKKNWKKGRYGAGQVVLFDDGDQLLVTSESGDLVLLRATPEKLDEISKVPAIESKTWNHPAWIKDRLYLRNSQQAACYEFTLQP